MLHYLTCSTCPRFDSSITIIQKVEKDGVLQFARRPDERYGRCNETGRSTHADSVACVKHPRYVHVRKTSVTAAQSSTVTV